MTAWTASGQYGKLFDGQTNVSITGKVAHFELGYPYNGGQLRYDAPVVELHHPCPFATRKTWAEVIQKLPAEERPQIIVAIDRQGGLHEVIGRKEAGEAARSLELAVPAETRGELSPAAIQQRRAAKDARENHERTIRAVDLAITGVIEKQAKAKDAMALFRLLRLLAMNEANFDTKRRVAKRYGYTTMKTDGDATAFYHEVAKKAETAPIPFIVETLL